MTEGFSGPTAGEIADDLRGKARELGEMIFPAARAETAQNGTRRMVPEAEAVAGAIQAHPALTPPPPIQAGRAGFMAAAAVVAVVSEDPMAAMAARGLSSSHTRQSPHPPARFP